MSEYKGQVFWHGLFPDITKTGRIVARGTVRHEVRWDGESGTSLESPANLMLVSSHGNCCAYCASVLAAAG